MITAICPCCSHFLLRHVRHHEIYWFCPHCYQEMPSLDNKGLFWHPPKLSRPTASPELPRLPVMI